MVTLNFQNLRILHSVPRKDLGSTQPLTEMSTRSIFWGYKRPVRKADNLTTILGHCHLNLNFLESSGHVGPVMGLIYLYLARLRLVYLNFKIIWMISI